MNYKVFNRDGNFLNTIVANESFVTAYCAEHGYTFEPLPDPEPAPEPPTPEERITLLEQSKADQTEVDAIAAAIEKGLSL